MWRVAPVSEEGRKRLHRMLKRDLGPVVKRTKRGTWTTTSSLPHEIRLHTDTGVDLVRISCGMVVDTKATKALLNDLNTMNTDRAFTRRIIVDGKVMVVAQMPIASLRKGDLEQMVSMVFCLARLDAPLLAVHGGRSVTDPPPALAPDFDRVLSSWEDVLRASGTATSREFAIWLDELVGCDCWIDRDEESVIVVMDGRGIGSEYPFRLAELRQAAEDLVDELDAEE